MRDLHRQFQPWARAILTALQRVDPAYRVTSSRRSKASQRALYAAFLSGTHPVTVAPPGCSKHEHGLAVDIASPRRDFLTDPYLRQIGAEWRAMGGEWGGEKDPIHFAMPGRLCR